MRKTRFAPRGLAAAALLAALAACADAEQQPAGPAFNDAVAEDTTGAADDVPVKPVAVPGPEQEILDVEREVPGFAGTSYTEGGTRQIFLTDLRQAGAASAALGKRGADEGWNGKDEYVQVRYSFSQLAAFRDKLGGSVLSVSGVTFLDADEGKNQVTVGVETAASAPAVQSAARAAGVPSDALNVVETGRVEQHPFITDNHPQLAGGLQISRLAGPRCTLGFVTNYGTSRAFVTNSHCSSGMWQLESSRFYQRAWSLGGNYVGYEVRDPAGWPCYAAYTCRYSDANIVRVPAYPVVPVPWGNIFRTTGFGSTNINTLNPWFQITSEQPWPTSAGAIQLHKVGENTGWTWSSSITNTCANVLVGGRVLMCQTLSNYASGAGDSGAAVFRLTVSNQVRLYGVHWGKVGSLSVFSPMWNVEFDLGPLTT